MRGFATKPKHQLDAGKKAPPESCRAGPVESLEPALAARMGERFGHDFRHVRIHADERAAEAAARHGARAFTVGHDVYLGTRPDRAGAWDELLLAHELAHVVQADRAAASPERQESPVDVLEREAHQAAAAMAGGTAAPPVLGVARNPAAVLRQPDDPGTPTYGNIPVDKPAASSATSARIVELVNQNGKWIDRPGPQARGSDRTAKGKYIFVVVGGQIFAAKPRVGLGHTELAQGGRVTWAGTITFTGKGALVSWDNGSGHYLPSGTAGQKPTSPPPHADLPWDKFKWAYQGPAVRPGGRKQGPQLPVFQPKPDVDDPDKPPAQVRGSGPAVPTPPGGVRLSVGAAAVQSALAGIKIWALVNLKSQNEALIKADKERIEKEVADALAAKTADVADRWINFELVYANVTTEVTVDWITHLTANVNPQSGMPSGPPEEHMRYIGATLSGVAISDKAEDRSTSRQLSKKGPQQGSTTTRTLDVYTVSMELPVDNAVVRARLAERIEALEREIERPAISTLDLELERDELKMRAALYSD